MSQTAEQKAAAAKAKADKEAQKQADDAAKAPEASEEATDTQQIKFLRSHPGYAYWPGDTADLTAEHVELLTTGGFAELVVAAETESENEE